MQSNKQKGKIIIMLYTGDDASAGVAAAAAAAAEEQNGTEIEEVPYPPRGSKGRK